MIGERRRPPQRKKLLQSFPVWPRPCPASGHNHIDDSIASRDLHGLCARLSDQLSQERELGPFAPHRRSSDLPRQSRGLRPSHSRVGTLPALACADSSRRISDHKRCRVAGGGTGFQLFCILLRVALLLLSSLGRSMTDIRSCGGSHAASSTAAAGHHGAKSCICTCYYRLVRLISSDAVVRPSPPVG